MLPPGGSLLPGPASGLDLTRLIQTLEAFVWVPNVTNMPDMSSWPLALLSSISHRPRAKKSGPLTVNVLLVPLLPPGASSTNQKAEERSSRG